MACAWIGVRGAVDRALLTQTVGKPLWLPPAWLVDHVMTVIPVSAICAGCASAGIGVGSTRAVQVLNDQYRAVQHLTNADLPADARRAPLSGRGADGKRMPRCSEVKGLHHMPSRTWLSAARCIRVESLRRPQPLVLGCWTLNRCKLTLLLPRPHIPDVPIPQSRVRIPRVPEG